MRRGALFADDILRPAQLRERMKTSAQPGLQDKKMNNTKSKITTLIADFIAFASRLAADQVTKVLALRLQGSDDLIVIDGVFQLHYLENRGAAFSMLQDATWVFVVATVVMAAVIGFVLFKVPTGKRYIMWHICLTMIGAGGIGNLIDRLRLSVFFADRFPGI